MYLTEGTQCWYSHVLLAPRSAVWSVRWKTKVYFFFWLDIFLSCTVMWLLEVFVFKRMVSARTCHCDKTFLVSKMSDQASVYFCWKYFLMHFSCIHSDGGFLLSLFHSSLYQISINWGHDKILSFHNWCLLTCSLQCWGQQQSIPAMRMRLVPLLHPHCPTSLVVSSLARGFFSLLPGNLWFQAVPHNQIVPMPKFSPAPGLLPEAISSESNVQQSSGSSGLLGCPQAWPKAQLVARTATNNTKHQLPSKPRSLPDSCLSFNIFVPRVKGDIILKYEDCVLFIYLFLIAHTWVSGSLEWWKLHKITLHLHILSSMASQYQRLCKEQGSHALKHWNFPSLFPQNVLQCLLLQSASDEGNHLVLNTRFLKSSWDLLKQRVLGMLASKYLIMIKCILHFSFLANTTVFISNCTLVQHAWWNTS